jgi:mono/diheme cytochrome c family protein
VSKPEEPSPRKKLEDEERRSPDIIPMHHPIMREMAEPKDGFEPTPVWLMLIYFALAGWGGYYLASNTGGFRSDIFTDDPRQSGTVAVAVEQAPPPDPMVLGKRVYNNCSTCHQPDGSGVAGVYPPLTGSEWVTGSTDALVRILLHGVNGPLVVNGETYNAEMPAWSQLSDEQIAAVLTYIRSSWGNAAETISPETVQAIRELESARTQHWTEAELREIAAAEAGGSGPAAE